MAKKQRASQLEEEPTTPIPKQDQQQEHEEDATDVTSSQASSEAEDGVESEEVETDDETDDEEVQPATSSLTPSKTPPPSNSNPKSSSSEEGSETESESEPEPEPTPKPKSINSKPVVQTSKSKPEPKSGTKRSADDDNKQTKKKKTTAEKDEKEQEEEEDKKKAFQRVFNEDDELAILKGLIDFTASTGNCPFKYHTAFYEFVKKSIHVGITLEQLRYKIRRMKVKFLDKTKNGKVPSFSKSIDKKIFDLSERIWGDLVKNEVEEKPKVNGKRAVKEPAVKKPAATKKLVTEPDSPLVVSKETRKVDNVESGDEEENPASVSLILNGMVPSNKSVGVSGLNAEVLKRGIELIEESKRRELESKWKKLQIAEMELFVKRAELVEYQASLILDALKSSSSH